MAEERRKHARVVIPLEASFLGRSGNSACRIGDISWGGCFVQAMAAFSKGQRTVITIPTRDGSVSVAGTVTSVSLGATVVYADPTMGFAVQFDPLTDEQIESLKDVLGDPPASLRSGR